MLHPSYHYSGEIPEEETGFQNKISANIGIILNTQTSPHLFPQATLPSPVLRLLPLSREHSFGRDISY